MRSHASSGQRRELMLMSRAVIYSGAVVHHRLHPVVHRFRHRVFFLRFALQRQNDLLGPLFSINRWNVFSFHDSDHGPRDGSPLLPWIRNLLGQYGLTCADGEICLQTFPRVLGYVFNPVSFWLCHDRAGRLRAVLAEVNNTFGERHNYLVAHPDQRPIAEDDWLEARKVFHVSPFLDVSGHYRFRFAGTLGRCCYRVDHHGPAGLQLATAISGSAQPLCSRTLLFVFIAYPLMTVGVMLRIHYHALRLWLKRVPCFSKPLPPAEETTR